MRDGTPRTARAPDVSVIVPSYNSERFIEGCVTSIFAQKGVVAEAVVVDDEGQDGTREALARLADAHPRLTVIHRPPKGGQATARNDGMAVAKGRYIAFLDSDDQFAGANVLRRWVAHADAHALDISCAQFVSVTEKGATRPGRRTPPTPAPAVALADAPGLVNVSSCWQLLYRRRFLKERGIAFSSRLRQREDRLFFVEALLRADRIGVTPLAAVRHLLHADSSFRRIDLDQLEQYNIHLELMVDVLEAAAAEGRLPGAFARANALVYWRMLFTYWAPFALQCLGDGPHAPNTREGAAADALLKWMARLSRGRGAFYKEALVALQPGREGLQLEATLDVGRLAASAGRIDFLKRLMAGDRLAFGEARSLVGPDAPPWAEEAVCRYLVFHRGRILTPAEAARETPPLGALVRRVVFHVGPPKTGSSALQQTLERNRLRLIPAGVHYPLTGTRRGDGVRRERTDGHARLIERIMRGDDRVRDELAREVAALDAPIDTLVLSSENIVSHRFWAADAPGGGATFIQRIVDALGVDHVEVVALFRRQDRWFHTYYREVIANPFNKVTDTPPQFMRRLKSLGLFDYEAIIAALGAPETVKAVHVEAYETVRRKGGTVAWTLERLGAGALDLAAVPRSWENASLSDAMAENVRLAKLNAAANDRALSEAFLAAVGSETLAQSGYSLLPAWFVHAMRAELRREIDAFAARFPTAAAPAEAPPAPEPLPLLPETRRILDGVARAAPKPKQESRRERLRREAQERPAMAAAALVDATAGQRLRLLFGVPLLRLTRSARQARLYAQRVLSEDR